MLMLDLSMFRVFFKQIPQREEFLFVGLSAVTLCPPIVILRVREQPFRGLGLGEIEKAAEGSYLNSFCLGL